MSLIAYIIMLAFTGLLVGGLARLLLPGRDPMSLPMTMLVGIGGSLLAGLVASAAFGRNGASFFLSVLFAVGIVYLILRTRGGSVTHSAPHRRGAFGSRF